MKRYISIRHWDYWFGIYGFCEFPSEVEFDITTDLEGEDIVFHFDLMDLGCMEYFIGNNLYIEKEDKEYNKFLESHEKLLNGSESHLVTIIRYPTKISGDNVSYKMFPKYKTGSLLDIKNNKGESSYYADIFINKRNDLAPWKLIYHMKKIMLDLFGWEVDLEITYIPSYEETLNSFFE
ncbi:hypothetical protein [Tissierella sp.]|uniref:hypothetical protein n=1 Tax=Tissierella sp. TaxID=41274 RepID=UPI0028AF07E1|nr:hypothetical protein [Tissierella sp.]